MLSHAGSARRIHPLTALLVIVWSIVSVYLGLLVEALILSMALTVYSRLLRRLAPLYAWVTVPVVIILALTLTPREAVVAGLKLLAIVMAATSALVMVNPLELGYMAARLHLPPMAGFIVPITIRVADYLTSTLWEARAAMRGRGIQGRIRQILLLPIPLIVHSFNVSLYVAEALSFKYPVRSRSWLVRPRVSLIDLAVVMYIGLATVYRIIV
ncbi:MAG: energy-coupling factor transporter transmembrane protein EcfT [Desulfurococcales archaeon]|nr:energy-coupling factor transporter transmembrane protein EcfT [Desulfurococcales archaeon]